MARFTYTAENQNGEVYRGVVDAPDRFTLYKMIRREGGTVLTVKKDVGKNIWSFSYWNAQFTTVPEAQKIIFARNLGAMLSAGLSLGRALSVMERQTKNVKLIDVLSQLGSDVRQGGTLNEALTKFPNVFPRLFVAMVKSGEEAGDLTGALKSIAEQMERSHTLKKKIKGALLYPAIIVVAIVGIGVLMMVEVVPTLAQTFEELGSELPASTQVIIGISDFLVENTIAAIALVSLTILFFIMGLRTRVGQRSRDFVFLQLPVVGGIVREVNAARTARTIGSLLTSGVDMLTTLSITEEVVQNSYFKEILREARDDVQKGGALSKTFARYEHLYPPLVGEMVSVGEETGALTEMLERSAEFYEESVARQTKDMSTVIEPFLMVAIGGAVGFFAISMIAPIYQLSENI